METRQLDRIRFVTRHFNDLQGLRYGVPLGLITLAWDGPVLLRAGLFLGAVLLALGAKRYYRHTFGEVEQQPADPAAELSPVSIFHPGGPVSRLEGVQQVTPAARHFLVVLVLAGFVFSLLQSMPPYILIEGSESLNRQPRVLLEPAFYFGQRTSSFYYTPWAGSLPTRRGDGSMTRATFAQLLYALYGSLFLAVWLWRGRRESQSHHLVLAVLLLGLSALGTSLGFFAGPDRELPRIMDLLLPALVYPRPALLLCGWSMVLVGLLDHWQLVRALGRPVAAGEAEYS